jgi:hypothetical protein
MRKSLLLAASLATIFVLANVDRSAEARGQPRATTAKPKAAKATPRRVAAGPRSKKTASAKGPGRCGTYMYWKGGKCIDARLPPKK